MKMSIVMMVLMASFLMAGTVEDYHERLNKAFVSAVSKADQKLEKAKKRREKEVGSAIRSYLIELEKVKDAYTKKGNLEKAIQVRDKIAEYDKLLKKGELKPKKSEEVKVKPKPEPKVDVEKALGYELKRHPWGAKKGPNGHYYMFVKGLTTWSDAYKKAKEMGGYLATVTTKEEFDFLCKLEKPGRGNDQGAIFVGAKRTVRKFHWITKEKMGDDVPAHHSHARYDSVSIIDHDGPVLAGLLGTGRNGSGLPLVKGFVVEWEK